MDQLSNDQLNAVRVQLDQALNAHEEWHKALLKVLITRGEPNDDDMHPYAYQLCQFGQWYERPENSIFHRQPRFDSLGDAHQSMHEEARKLLFQLNDDANIEAHQIDRFYEAAQTMRGTFHELREELVTVIKHRDPLTGARSRADMADFLATQQALVRRNLQPCALAMLDLDHFKQINDTHGHPCGDTALVATVKAAQGLIRPYDRIYRYGGEEFLICMPGMNAKQAEAVLERIRLAIGNLSLTSACGEAIRLSISSGIAELGPDVTIEGAIHQADEAMYLSKKAGRNQTTRYSSLVD